MWIKNIFLLFFGLCSGGIIAAGVYAFLAIHRCFCAADRENEDKEKYHAL